MRKQILTIGASYLSCTKPLVYISGKVTGLDPEITSRKFTAAEFKLNDLGYQTFNPTAWLNADTDWQKAMKLCISILPMCDAIYLLPDWHESRGAVIERDTALLLGIPTIEL